VHDHVLFPEVPVELDRMRHFRIDFNALIQIQQSLDGQLPADGELMRLPISKVRDVFAAALRHEDPNLTPADVGRWIHVGNMKDALAAFERAWKLAMGEGDSPARPLLRAMLQ